jgi:hypothetical protein
VVEKSHLKVKIQKTFFKGNGYLIEALFENQVIYFENEQQLSQNEFVFLALKE